MVIYIPTKEQVEAIDLGRDRTLKGETRSLDETILANPHDFISTFFPDERIDSTYRKIVEMSLESNMPAQVVTHYCHDEKLKGHGGKIESMGYENVWNPLVVRSKGETCIFITKILTNEFDDRVHIVSHPAYIERLDLKSLLEPVEDFPLPEFDEKIKRKSMSHYVHFAEEDVLTRLGMVSGFCYPCPSDILVNEGNIDIQIIMDGSLMAEYQKKHNLKADIPIELSRHLGPNQEVSFQINYAHLYELLAKIFPERVKVAGCY